MRQVRHIMGMPITIDIPGCDDPAVFETAFGRLRQIDNKFSTHKPGSEVSKLANLPPSATRLNPVAENVSAEMREVIRACLGAEKWTDGYFSAWYSGKFDPSGYVKGWAIAEAGKVIARQGFKTYCIGAGGDILARSNGERNWNIGIQDPRDKTKILEVLSISNGSVATSGNYERGAHIINPKTKQPATELLSVTVTGPDIIKADILATACFAMGKRAYSFMKRHESYTALIIDKHKFK